MNLIEAKSLIRETTGLLPEITNYANGDIAVFVMESGQKRTLLNYIKTDNKNNISSGYMTTQSWWKKSISEEDKSYFFPMIKVKKKDGISIHDVNLSIFKRYLTAYFSGSHSFQSQIKRDPPVKKKKSVLTSSQSKAIKELNDYTCDSCNITFKDQPPGIKNKLLQVHHKIRDLEGNRNHISNLCTLCTICHGKQEGKGHHFQRNNEVHHSLILRLRQEQGIK